MYWSIDSDSLARALQWIIFPAIGLAVFLFVMKQHRDQLREYQEREPEPFSSRQPQSPGVFHRKYFSHLRVPQSNVIELLHDISDSMCVQPEFIRPGDSFFSELEDAPDWGYGTSGMGRLMAAAEKRAVANGTTVDFTGMETVEDFILLSLGHPLLPRTKFLYGSIAAEQDIGNNPVGRLENESGEPDSETQKNHYES